MKLTVGWTQHLTRIWLKVSLRFRTIISLILPRFFAGFIHCFVAKLFRQNVINYCYRNPVAINWTNAFQLNWINFLWIVTIIFTPGSTTLTQQIQVWFFFLSKAIQNLIKLKGVQVNRSGMKADWLGDFLVAFSPAMLTKTSADGAVVHSRRFHPRLGSFNKIPRFITRNP